MKYTKLPLCGLALIVVAGCGSDEEFVSPFGGAKAEESGRIIDDSAYEHNGWRIYNAREDVALGGNGSREALIRLYIPPKQGVAIIAPPVAKLEVRLPEGDELTDENFSSLLYHDYYLRGPKAKTHKYLIELKPSRAEVNKGGTYKGTTHYSLTWKLDEVVGDPSNAKTWAISLTSQRWPVGQGGKITTFEMKFKSDLTKDDGQWYTTNSWPGYTGFEILRDVTVPGRAEPRLSVAPTPCTLKAGAKYHSRDGEDVTPLSYRSRIVSYKATSQFEVPEEEWYKDENDEWQSRLIKTHVVAAGQIIEELTWLEEEHCRVRKQGEIETFEMECPSGHPNLVKADDVLPSYEEFFQVTCIEDGHRAWIFTTDLYPLFNDYITDYESAG